MKIEQYDNSPEVRMDGRVYIKGKEVLPGIMPTNCLRVGLNINGRYVERGVHVLVARAHIPNPEGFHYISHRDGNKLNNDVSNLEWVKNASQIPPESLAGIQAAEDFRKAKEAAKVERAKKRKQKVRAEKVAYKKKRKQMAVRAKQYRDENSSRLWYDDHKGLHGEFNHRAVLTPADVAKIRSMYETGKYRQKDIALEFGVTPMNVHKIVTYKTWKHERGI